jgi:hypothetical protein
MLGSFSRRRCADRHREDSMTATTFFDRWASLRNVAVAILADFARAA